MTIKQFFKELAEAKIQFIVNENEEITTKSGRPLCNYCCEAAERLGMSMVKVLLRLCIVIIIIEMFIDAGFYEDHKYRRALAKACGVKV